MERVAAALRAPFVAFVRPLDRAVVVMDDAPAADSEAGVRVRRILATLVLLAGVVLSGQSLRSGEIPTFAQLLIVMLAVALFLNRGGRFLRDWIPIFVGGLVYFLSAKAVENLGLSVHVTPQIRAEQAIFGDTLPTVWLQDRLYDGTTGVLEVFTSLMYISHFIAPVMLAFLLWAVFDRRGFVDLFLGILTVTLLAEVVFVLAPTAPPWLAAEQGLIAPIHEIIKSGFADMGLTPLADRFHGSGYNTVAAIPSLHAAWPLIGLFVVVRHGLPRWLAAFQVFLVVGVLFAVVYAGEHYVVDALVGYVFAIVAWRLLGLAQRPRARAPQPDGT